MCFFISLLNIICRARGWFVKRSRCFSIRCWAWILINYIRHGADRTESLCGSFTTIDIPEDHCTIIRFINSRFKRLLWQFHIHCTAIKYSALIWRCTNFPKTDLLKMDSFLLLPIFIQEIKDNYLSFNSCKKTTSYREITIRICNQKWFWLQWNTR